MATATKSKSSKSVTSRIKSARDRFAELGEDWVWWVRTAADERAAAEGCWPDRRAGELVNEFFETNLTHGKDRWAGRPFLLSQYQKDTNLRLFGWRRSDGRRRFRRAYLSEGKKNGKSARASGWALYGLVGDGQQGPHVYCGAVDREQARIVFDESADMVSRSAVLSKRLQIIPSTKRIVYRKAGGFMHALSADAYQKEGLNASMVLIDELHAHRDRRWFDALWYAGRSRSEPLTIIITTAGEELESICGEVYERAKNILDGTLDDTTFYAEIWEAPEGCVLDDEAAWKAANPNLGVTFTAETMREEAEEAMTGRIGESRFRRYCLNQWCSLASRMFDMRIWDQESASEPFDRNELSGKCYGGLDLSSTHDLTSLCLLFPDRDEVYRAAWWFWCPEAGAAKRQQRDLVPYVDWAKAGLIELCPGSEIDYGWLRAKLNNIFEKYSVQVIGVDRLFQGGQLSQELTSDGWPMETYKQTFFIMGPVVSDFDRLVNLGKFRHGGNPIARWMANNCVPEMDSGGLVKPSKGRSRDRIDGIVAAIMALGTAVKHGSTKTESVYEKRGLVAFGSDGRLLGD